MYSLSGDEMPGAATDSDYVERHSSGPPRISPSPGPSLDNMVLISGNKFRVGSDRHYPEEAPARDVTVDGFWIDRVPVTNRDFLQFVNATGYVTLAEQKPDPK